MNKYNKYFFYFFRLKDKKEISESKKFDFSYKNSFATLTIRDMTDKDAGTYTCQATNVLGEASTTGKLEIQRKTTLIIIIIITFL